LVIVEYEGWTYFSNRHDVDRENDLLPRRDPVRNTVALPEIQERE
jgi:hypothetical protein